MTGKEAIKLSKRSESWLRRHECSWCGQTLWGALVHGCGAIFERCDPTKKDFDDSAKEGDLIDLTYPQFRKKVPPKILDAITDKVLRYRPKSKE